MISKEKRYEQKFVKVTDALRDSLGTFNYKRLARVLGMSPARLSNIAGGRVTNIRVWELKLLRRFYEELPESIPPEEYW